MLFRVLAKKPKWSFNRRPYCTVQNYSFYDIVIAGGGLVGAAMAASLNSSPYFRNKSTLMLEAGPSKPAIFDPAAARPYSNRVSAINPSSKSLFEKFGVWQRVEKSNRLKPVRQLQVWESCSQSKIHFEKENFSGEVAYIVENDLLVDCCMEHLRREAGSTTEIRHKSAVAKIDLPKDLSSLVAVELSDGTKLRTNLLVAADGANSAVRRAMGVHTVAWSYDQRAVVATMEVSAAGDNDIAWQRFTPNGPVALLPLTPTLSSLVWTTGVKEAERLCALPEDQFVDALNRELHEETLQNHVTNGTLEFLNNLANAIVSPASTDVRLIAPTVVKILEKSRASFPLGLSHASHYVQPRVALVGDAAHRVHPLAGQGVNMGFGDVITLTRVLEEALREGADFGSMLYLSKYETLRQRHNVPVMVAIDWLNRLYSTQWFPLVWARSVGLQTVDRMEWLKKLIVNEASV